MNIIVEILTYQSNLLQNYSNKISTTKNLMNKRKLIKNFDLAYTTQIWDTLNLVVKTVI